MRELFEFPPTRSNRVKWTLLELGLPYTSRIVDLREQENRTAEYRRIHPLGHVPALRTDSYEMHESVAILMQLLDEHPSAGLAPLPGSASRASYYQWCVFACSELDPATSDVMLHTMHLPTSQRVAAIAERGMERFAERASVVETCLKSQQYLGGDEFSGADIAVGYSCDWAAYTGQLRRHPVLAEYYERLMLRPACREVFPPRPRQTQ